MVGSGYEAGSLHAPLWQLSNSVRFYNEAVTTRWAEMAPLADRLDRADGSVTRFADAMAKQQAEWEARLGDMAPLADRLDLADTSLNRLAEAIQKQRAEWEARLADAAPLADRLDRADGSVTRFADAMAKQQAEWEARLADRAPLAERLANQLGYPDLARFAGALGPRLDDLAVSVSGVVRQLPPDLAGRTANPSVDLLGRIASGGSPEATVEQLADEIASSPEYEELWEDVQAEVETLLEESAQPPARTSIREGAAWHISWLLLSIRTSLPSAGTVEQLSKVVSVSAVALICCAVLQTAYPSLWSRLQELQLSPFDLAGFVFAAMAWAEVRRGQDD